MHFTSHTGQDKWVAEIFKYKKCGYFLDFGGFDGIMTSNTFYLEKHLSWRGILVEPNPEPYTSACATRSCITLNCALWDKNFDVVEFINAHGLSCVSNFYESDINSELRKQMTKNSFLIQTLTPNEILKRFNSPNLIEYMSLDIEGAEEIILKSIDFHKFQIATMSIEHNHDSNKRENIKNYLINFGYEVIEHWNDDLYFNYDIINCITSGNFQDPIETEIHIKNSYKFFESINS